MVSRRALSIVTVWCCRDESLTLLRNVNGSQRISVSRHMRREIPVRSFAAAADVPLSTLLVSNNIKPQIPVITTETIISLGSSPDSRRTRQTSAQTGLPMSATSSLILLAELSPAIGAGTPFDEPLSSHLVSIFLPPSLLVDEGVVYFFESVVCWFTKKDESDFFKRGIAF